MRVLVVSAPLLGHLLPLVPLAAALRAAGHDVRIAAGADALRAAAQEAAAAYVARARALGLTDELAVEHVRAALG